jgi:uncharacterized OB-fold protein
MNEAAPLWSNARDAVLVIPHCTTCDRFAWPPRARCMQCGGAMSWKKATGAGTLVTWSVVRRAVDPALKDAVPYVIAIVELDEGVRLFTNLIEVDVAAGAIQAGLRVRCRFQTTTDDAAWVPVFAPGE